MPDVSLNGADFFFRARGSGPPILFVYGMCGDADVRDEQVDRLGGRFRCVTYDRRGHSRSSLGDVPQRTVGLHGDDAAALIRALGLAPCLLVGSSGGARVGLDVVRRYPVLMRVADRLAEGIPVATLVRLQACGHVTYAEQPAAFAAAVRALAAAGGPSPLRDPAVGMAAGAVAIRDA
jgi:pimeloyl-ACP methyl ester carboxylesterase